MKLNILFLSEDDRFVLEMIAYNIESSLKDCAIGVFKSNNKNESLEIIEKHDIHLIIGDMDIDSIEASQFYDEIHTNHMFDSISFVFLSKDVENQEIAILKGFDNFFLKPLNVDSLLYTLHDILYEIQQKEIKDKKVEEKLQNILELDAKDEIEIDGYSIA